MWCECLMMFLPALLACSAFVCSAIFTFFCESVQLESNDPDLPNVELSLYTSKRYYVQELPDNQYQVKSGCFYFETDVSFDSKWKTARAFGVMTLIIGGFAVFASILGPMCDGLGERPWKALAAIYIVVLPLFQGLTFLMLQSNICSGDARIFDFMDDGYSDCQWNGGSTANVVGIVLWFITGAFMLVSGTPVREARKPAETQEVTYERTENPDGTFTVNETNVVKGTDDAEGQAAD